MSTQLSQDKLASTLPHLQESSMDSKSRSLIFSGTWRSLYLAPQEKITQEIFLSYTTPQEISLTFSEDFYADTAGGWLIGHFFHQLSNSGHTLKGNIPEIISKYINKEIPPIPIPPKAPLFTRLFTPVGKEIFYVKETILSLLSFFGQIVITFLRYSKKNTPEKLQKQNSHDPLKSNQFPIRWVSLAHHLDVIGIQAIPIISLISILIGAVLAYQGVNQLNRFGASIYTVDFLAISLLREISVLLTSIVIAGRSGSAFTAQIGTMALNQEIDAIRMLGLNPLQVLVIPRILALLIALPVLVLLSCIMGAIGGMIITHLTIDLTFAQFWDLFQKAVSKSTFWVGMSKAPLFALIISVIGCYRGMQVKGSAESVGAMTTQSVVESIFLILVCDGFVSILYSSLDI